MTSQVYFLHDPNKLGLVIMGRKKKILSRIISGFLFAKIINPRYFGISREAVKTCKRSTAYRTAPLNNEILWPFRMCFHLYREENEMAYPNISFDGTVEISTSESPISRVNLICNNRRKSKFPIL
jgi:hypothetical protein